MNSHPRFTRPTRSVLTGFFVVAMAALAIGWTAGTVAASSGSRAASPTAAPTTVPADTSGVPGVGTTTTLSQNAGEVASSGGVASSIAYPVTGYNSLGVAPQGTILAEGTGTAGMKANGSDQAAALKTATDAAFADAHVQALAAATSMGVQLAGIYSVSIASNDSYAYATPDCVAVPPVPGNATGASASTGTAPASTPIVCEQATPTSAQLVVTLIVAYKYA